MNITFMSPEAEEIIEALEVAYAGVNGARDEDAVREFEAEIKELEAKLESL